MLLGRRTPVTTLLLVAITACFAAQFFLGRGLIEQFANYGPAVRQGEYWRLVTSMFLHGGIVHLVLNAWALYQLGSLFEILMGSGRLAGVYLAAGIAGSLASAFWSDVPSVGASGAIFGLLGALISFLLRRRENLTPQAKALLGQLVMWAVINVAFGFSGAANIDNAAHMGGLVAGLLAGLLLREPERRRLAEV
jgi:rhomboid protease GluP